jgi:SAM-dependent methyltransferase
MSATDRLVSEKVFHDRQAAGRAPRFRDPAALRFHNDSYLDHETWIRPAFTRLGRVSGLSVLDFGCGHGMAAVVLARLGARVTAIDLSPGYLAEVRLRAQANGVCVALVQADGTHLPFPDASFDRVWGNAVLHHLDLHAAARELYRVLKPGGAAVFCEPWGGNPLLAVARRSFPYPGKDRTPDEEPFRSRHVALLRQTFPDLHVQGFQLVSMLRRVLAPRRVVASLDRCDAVLLARVPGLQHFCRYVVLTLRRPSL